MADIGLPGYIPGAVVEPSTTGTFIMNTNPTVSSVVTKFVDARIVYETVYNYLYKCPAASSGIRLNQTLWFN